MDCHQVTKLHPKWTDEDAGFWLRVMRARNEGHLPVAAVLRSPWRWLNASQSIQEHPRTTHTGRAGE